MLVSVVNPEENVINILKHSPFEWVGRLKWNQQKSVAFQSLVGIITVPELTRLRRTK